AADADGDGIADSGYIKLPVGPIDGVTYYAAVRIVDNSAAVNANIAWTSNPIGIPGGPTITAPQLPGDFFPSCIDFQSMLTSTDYNPLSPANNAFNSLLRFRFNLRPQSPVPAPSQAITALDDYSPNPSLVVSNPRTDFNGTAFTSALEAEWTQMGRRLKNPGRMGNGPVPFGVLPIGETANLAQNFILRNPNVLTPNTSPNLLEQALPNSLFASSPSVPYLPSDTQNWYLNNFYFFNDIATGVNRMPIRSLLVTENPVSNFAPTKFRDFGTTYQFVRGQWVPPLPAGVFQFGDMITYTDPNVGGPHRFVCINPNEASTFPPVPSNVIPYANSFATPSQSWALDNEAWVYEPWSTSQTKVSANTASFGQLWLAYWSVMAEAQQQSEKVSGTYLKAPAYPNPEMTSAVKNPLLSVSARMFRSPLRTAPPMTPNNPFRLTLTPVQVMQLRAALAAVNTIDLRDSDDDVSSRTVHLIDNTQPAPMNDVIATVYGIERQPFITQVYAINEATSFKDSNGNSTAQPGYVAIELYNPTPLPIILRNWTFATITRPDTVQTLPLNLNLVPTVVKPDSPWDTVADSPQIPPGGFAIFASNDTPPQGLMLPPNVSVVAGGPLPTGGSATVPLYVMHNLTNVFNGTGQELMLFRTRRDNGDITFSAAPTTAGATFAGATQQNQILLGKPAPANYPAYAEVVNGAPNPADMVPVDSYDFTGMPPGIPPPPSPTEWYYARPNAQSNNPRMNKAWHFVYPGHYVFAQNPLGPPSTALQQVQVGGNPPRLADGTAAVTNDNLGLIFVGNNHIGGILGQGSTIEIPLGLATTGVIDPLRYRDVTIQLNNTDFGGPNGVRASTGAPAEPNAFPYGGFARNGDLLQVPFIGSYRLAVVPTTGVQSGTMNIIELNPVTMDSAMALGLAQQEWGELPDSIGSPGFTPDPSANPNGANPIVNSTGATVENIGRFCPISQFDFANTPNSGLTLDGAPLDDYQPEAIIPSTPTTPPINVPSPGWLYHFGTHLFDYLTVQSPQQDYLPDVDPSPADPNSLHQGNGQYAGTWNPGGIYSAPPQVSPVANVSQGTDNAEPTNAVGATEETVPTNGLININTAPWRVLATIPWLPPVGAPLDAQKRASIALNIVRYRDVDDGSNPANPHGHGPFRSIFELNNVPISPNIDNINNSLGAPPPPFFRDLMGPAMTTDFNAVQGNLSPAYAVTPDGVTGDFEGKYMMINRVSNLITTRSDSYTAYILIQGWRDAETDHPTLVVQRRATYLIDRSSVTPANQAPTMTKIPNTN
ncbi:MAG TPA: hypothetical protein VN541_10310, partial [Tepidisphaeraceae bacterium]|nr:hypothetical protein [Tepidisphaeraceae bacterium]